MYERILSGSKASSKEIIFEYLLSKVVSISSATFFLNSPNLSWPTLLMKGVNNQPFPMGSLWDQLLNYFLSNYNYWQYIDK